MNRERRFRQLEASLKACGQRSCLQILNTRYDDGDLQMDGGPGSGNWGHEGRKGLRGGSAPGGGKKNRFPAQSGYTSRAKALKALRPVRDWSEFAPPYKGEIQSLPLNAPIRIFRVKDVFYRDGKGNVVSPSTGATYREEDLDGKQIAYHTPMYRKQETDIDQVRKLYQDGILKPHDVVAVKKTALPTHTGAEILAKNGKTYRAENGQWVEVGPCGKISNPKGVPSLNRGYLEGLAVGNLYDLVFAQRGVDRREVERLSEYMEYAPKPLKDSYTKAFAEGTLIIEDANDTAFYAPNGSGSVTLKSTSGCMAILHEYAHYIDGSMPGSGIQGSGISKRLESSTTPEMRNQDLARIAGKASALTPDVSPLTDGKGALINSQAERAEAGRALGASFKLRTGSEVTAACMMDMVSSITKDGLLETVNGGGHEQTYWDEKWSAEDRIGGPAYVEPAAEYLTLKAMGDEYALEIMRDVTPNLMKELDRLYGEAFGT